MLKRGEINPKQLVHHKSGSSGISKTQVRVVATMMAVQVVGFPLQDAGGDFTGFYPTVGMLIAAFAGDQMM